MERLHSGLRLPAQRVVDADDGGELAGDAEVEVGILGGQGVELCLLAGGNAAALVFEDKVRAADEDLFLIHHARNAVGDDVLHLGMILLVRQAAGLGFLDHGVGHGVRIVFLQARGKAQHLALFVAAKGDDLRDGGGRIGERAGLVEDDSVRLRDGLEEASALDGDMMAAALAHGREHRDGHGELERAGKVDHENGEHLGDVARDEIGEDGAAERVGHEPVGKAGGLVLGSGFELFGLFNHPDDAVIAAAAELLFHADDALALFGDGACVNKAALALGNGHGLARHRRLIDHRLARDDLAVERDEVAGAHDDAVARLDVADGDEDLGLAGPEPDVVDIERHCAGEIGNGLLVRPVLKNFTEAEHEHHGACRRKVAAHHRDGDGGGVEHGDRELAVQQRGETLADIFDGMVDGERRGDREREEELGEHAADDRPGELVLKLAVQRPGGVVRHEVHGLCLVKRERRECPDERGAVRAVGDHGVLCAVVDRDLGNTVNIAQIVFQNVRLAQRHAAAGEMHAHPACGFMQNFALHWVSTPLRINESRVSRLSGALFVRLFLFGRIFDDSGVLLRCAALVDVLGVGVDVFGVFTDSGHGLHHAVLGAQHRGGGVGVDLLGVLAGKNLETGGAEQHARCK